MNLESIPIQAFLIVSSALFCIGIWGLLNSRNAVRVLMSIELMLNAVNINLMAFSSYVDNNLIQGCLLYTSPSPRDNRTSRMPSSA